VENCFTPPRHHDISQVIYLKGSGGLEIHCTPPASSTDAAGADCPFDVWTGDSGEVLDVDAVFRDEVDQSTYSLYIGCGGCVATADPIVIPPVQLNGYEPAVIEPFTQTRYSSVFPMAARKYNSSGLRPGVCDQNHFTIRLVDYMNRTDGKPIVWGAVIGLAETFTFNELMLFPVFVLRNHGDTWNEQGWTIWATVFVFAPLLLVLSRGLLRFFGLPVLQSMPVTMRREKGKRMPIIIWRSENPRIAFYEIAVIAFVAAMFEEFIHLNIAAQGTSAGDYGYWVGLFAVILFANGFPLWQVLTSWAAIEYRKTEPDGRLLGRCRHRYWVCSGSPLWAPFEILFGFSYFLLFGAGFYVGPTMICLAGITRLGELRTRGLPKVPRPRYKVTFARLPPKGQEPPSDTETKETDALLWDDISQRPGLYVSA